MSVDKDLEGRYGSDNGIGYLSLNLFNFSIVSLGLMQNNFNKVSNEEVN